MEYTLDIYEKQPQILLMRLAGNCRSRRLEKGYSRNTLAKLSGVPASTIEHFECTGKISLESFCRIALEFDYFDEMTKILSETKYTTGEELARINKNRTRIKGR